MTEGSTTPAEGNADPVPPLSPTRPDGWPDWLGRRPIPATERDRLSQTIDADRLSRETARTQADQQLAPHFSYIVIEGFSPDQNPRKRTRLRARLTIALRLAAGEDHRTHYEATGQRITLGIAGPDARERARALRQEIQRIGRGHRWTITEDPH